MTSLEGILPFTASGSKDFVSPLDYRYQFLVGNGQSKPTCGVWMKRGCLESENHHQISYSKDQLTLDGSSMHNGVDVVEFFKASCGRLACPVCYEKACAKEAIKIAHRIMAYKVWFSPIHVTASVSYKDSFLTFPEMRRKAIKMVQGCGFIGGCVIFHPFRKYNEDDNDVVDKDFSWKDAPACWYISPHFHFLGYGWINKTDENYEESGWIVKNLGRRIPLVGKTLEDAVRATAHYQLSHCGINKRFHTVVWFGKLCYNDKKFHCPPLEREKHPCPICNSEMRKVHFIDHDDEDIVISSLENEDVFTIDHGLLEYDRSFLEVFHGG